MLKIAVVGSRTFTNYELIKKTLDTYKKKEDIFIISGGARGADSLAQRYAKENGLSILIIYPNYRKFGKKAPLIRNREIVENCDLVIAFPDKNSRGTWHTIQVARKMGKPVKIVKEGEK